MADQKSKIREILTKEYEWEHYLLAVLSLVAIVLGILIFTDVLTVMDGILVLSDNPMLLPWTLVIVGIFGLILSIVKISKKLNL